MAWFELQFLVPQKDVECVSDMLFENGALSVTMSEGPESNEVFSEPNTPQDELWKNTFIKALTTSKKSALSLKNKILQKKVFFSEYHVRELEENNWENSWKKHHKPLQVSKKIWICPSWISPPDPTAINVIIDPQRAFGTGSHETTKLCLNWLGQNNLCNKKVFDYGCGSGILGITAAKLGAEVYAWDIDDQALEITKENALLNNAQIKINSTSKDVDIVIANILLEPLQALHEKLTNLLSTTGRVVLSGILAHQVTPLKNCYSNIQWDEQIEDDCWILISGIKKPRRNKN